MNGEWKNSLDRYLTNVPEYDFAEEDEIIEEMFSNCCGRVIIGEVVDNLSICPECLEHCEVVGYEDEE